MLVEDYRKGSKKGRMGGEGGNYLDGELAGIRRLR